MNITFISPLLIGAFIACPLLLAQEQDSSAGLKVSGYADMYYRHAFNKAASLTSNTLDHGSFSFGWISLGVSHAEGKAGINAEVVFGPRAQEYFGSPDNVFSHIRQAYIHYSPTEVMRFSLGTFTSHIGYEYDDPGMNLNYSNSYINSFTPASNTGARVEYAFSEHIDVMLGVFNDIDKRKDEHSGKHIGGQCNVREGDFSGILNFLAGAESESLKVVIVNLAGDMKVSAVVNIGFDLAYQSFTPSGLPNGMWMGGALYAATTWSEAFTLCLRGEHFSDEDGYNFSGLQNSLTSFTVTGNWTLGHLKVMPEVRYDTSTTEVFVDNTGQMRKSEPSLLVGVTYHF
jgi:hypothetical protein